MSQIQIKVQRYNSYPSTLALLKSQLTLFNYRKRWGMIYALATLAGLFSIPGAFVSVMNTPDVFSQIVISMVTLPLSSLFIIIGMYVFNDLVDADLDKSNGKKRPIPSGEVSKFQAWIFIIGTNSLGIALSLVTLNIFTLLISLSLVSIGIMYSAPRIAFKDKFLVKTISIAVAMMLCISLGSTSYWSLNIDKASEFNSLGIQILYPAIMLAIMVFITSPFNDVADVVGDKKTGRKTIPIVIGSENTVKLAIALAGVMIAISWILYFVSTTGWINPLLVSLVSILTIYNMSKTLKNLTNKDYVRKQHKKSMPLHLLLQLALAIGASLVFI
jgi:geranylgeranylglycerol-phosphate geranylgeranyltransferase